MAVTQMSYTQMTAAAGDMQGAVDKIKAIQTQVEEIVASVASSGFGGNTAIKASLEKVTAANKGIVATVLADCDKMIQALTTVAESAKKQEEENAKAYTSYAGSASN